MMQFAEAVGDFLLKYYEVYGSSGGASDNDIIMGGACGCGKAEAGSFFQAAADAVAGNGIAEFAGGGETNSCGGICVVSA